MKTLLSPLTDSIFKLIFGDRRNSPILISFLQAAIDIPPEEYDHLSFVDPHLLREGGRDKMGILDVKVHTKSGMIINVEMQVTVPSNLRNRIVYSAAKMLTSQMRRGQDYNRLEKVISIIILKGNLLGEEGGYYNEYSLNNRKTGGEFSDLLEIKLLELSKLPEEGEAGDRLWLWGKFFTAKSEEEYEMVAELDAGVGQAVAGRKELSEDERTELLEESRAMWLWDHQTLMKDNYEAGMKDGTERALRETAARLKTLGLSPDQILTATGIGFKT